MKSQEPDLKFNLLLVLSFLVHFSSTKQLNFVPAKAIQVLL